jgi:hypothetical protein
MSTDAARADAAGDAATLVCQRDQACTAGQTCETACAVEQGQSAPTSTVCTCAPAGGRMALACVSIPCGADARPATAVCPNGIRNDDDCNAGTDTVCVTSCASQTLLRCVCAPRIGGGGGGPRWMCGATTMCLP